MFLEKNPFPKDINDYIAGIIMSERGRLKADGEESENLSSQSTIWEEHLTRPILNQLMTKPYIETSLCETARLHRIGSKFKGKDPLLLQVQPFIQELFPDKNVRGVGGFYYPPGGFMGWHTNYNTPALRFYITYTSHANKSFFRYLNDRGEIVTDYDDEGITLRLFDIPSNYPYFWHCVGSDCDRYSFGSRLSDK